MNRGTYWQFMDNVFASRDANGAFRDLIKTMCREDLVAMLSYNREDALQAVTPAHLVAAYMLSDGFLSEGDFVGYKDAIASAPRNAFQAASRTPDAIFDFPVYRDSVARGIYRHAFGAEIEIVARERFGSEWREWNTEWDTPIDLDNIEYNGMRGLKIVTVELAKQFAPRIYEAYGARCEWHERS